MLRSTVQSKENDVAAVYEIAICLRWDSWLTLESKIVAYERSISFRRLPFSVRRLTILREPFAATTKNMPLPSERQNGVYLNGEEISTCNKQFLCFKSPQVSPLGRRSFCMSTHRHAILSERYYSVWVYASPRGANTVFWVSTGAWLCRMWGVKPVLLEY